jgi:hypothetical protein
MSPSYSTQTRLKSTPLSKLRGKGSLTGYLRASEYSESSGFGVQSPDDYDITASPKFDFEKGKLRWGGSWLNWAGSGRYNDLIPLGPFSYSYQAIWDSKYPEDVRSELIRFLRTLELWEKTPGEKIITPHEVWAGSLISGPDFAEQLKDIFDLSWREAEYDSYNFVFPARFLPRWSSGTDDLLLVLEETYSDPDVLEEFEITLGEILDRVVERSEGIITLADDEQILFDRSTTTSYIYSEKRRLPQWEASLQCRKFNTTCFRGERCVVPVYPGGIRDTIIADISCNNSVRWIERSLREILQFVPESAVTKTSSTFLKRVEDVVNFQGWHVLRDIKKCGLTYNVKDLFPIVREQLNLHFPDHRWDRLNMFNDMAFVDDDVEYEAKRGYFLGMANHVVTLCNIVIHYMARNSLPSEYTGWTGRAILGNDDADIAFSKKHIAEQYLECEHDIQGRLGNLTNFKKSVIKPYGLFYEQYNKPGWKHKESLVCNALACAYLAPDIRTAKLYIASQSERFDSPWTRQELRNLVEWWGPEFFTPGIEYNINFEIGGWLNTTGGGLKTSLRDIDRLVEKYDVRYLSYVARYCKIFMQPPRPVYHSPGLVYNHMFKGKAAKADPLVQLYTITDEDLRTYYKKLTTYQRRYSSRIEQFYKRTRRLKVVNDVDALMRLVLGDTPWHQIPDSLAEEDPIWAGTIHTNFLHELESETEDHIADLLSLASGDKDLSMVYLETLKWDPKILPRYQNQTLISDVHQVFFASQFSNCGTIPLLEYYERWETLPICRPIGARQRLPSLVGSREYKRHILSRFYRKKRGSKPTTNEEFTLTFGSESVPSIEDMDKAMLNFEGMPGVDVLIRERDILQKEREAAARQVSDEDYSRLEHMAAAIQSRDDYHVYMRQHGYPQEESIDVFDNEDEDMGFDFLG